MTLNVRKLSSVTMHVHELSSLTRSVYETCGFVLHSSFLRKFRRAEKLVCGRAQVTDMTIMMMIAVATAGAVQ